MRINKSYLLSALLSLSLYAGLLTAVEASDVQVTNHDGQGITLVNGDVEIHAKDGSVARITSNGDLSIAGKAVAVTAEQRTLLQQYASGIRTIEDQGLDLGMQAVHMLGGFVGVLVKDLLSGTSGKQMDHDIDSKAMPLKDSARTLCDTVKSQQTLQGRIVAALPAFKPYAVIDTDSDHDCHIDNNED